MAAAAKVVDTQAAAVRVTVRASKAEAVSGRLYLVGQTPTYPVNGHFLGKKS